MAEKDILLNFEINTEESEKSIERLRNENRKLTQERNKVNTATKEGQAQIKALNTQIDKNNKLIKENSSAIEKQRLNVGNYKESIKGAAGELQNMSPALGRVTSGIGAMTKASLTFLATPIGAVIGAIGIALGALISYLKGTEAGQNRLNKITRVLSFLFQRFVNILQDFGEAIFDAFSDPIGSIEKLGTFLKERIFNILTGLLELIPNLAKAVGLLFKGEFKEAGDVAFNAVTKVATGVENMTDKIDQAKKATEEFRRELNRAANLATVLAAFEAGTDALERQLIVQKAVLEAKIAENKLRSEDKSIDIQTRIDLLKEAQTLQQELSDATVNLAKNRRDILQLEIEQQKEGTKEQKKELAELNAALFVAEKERSDRLTELFTKEQGLREEQRTKALEAQARNEKEIGDRLSKNLEKSNKIAVSSSLEKLKAVQVASLKEQQIVVETEQAKSAAVKRTQDFIKQQNEETLENLSSFTSQVAGIFDQESEAYKAFAAAQTIIDTYRAATAALAPPPTGAGPIFGPIFAATAIATGLSNLNKILSTDAGFAEGGFTGTGGKYDVAGVVHKNEYVIPKKIVTNPKYSGVIQGLERERLRGYADGGLVTNSAVASIDQNMIMSNAIKRLPSPVVSVEEFSKVQNRVQVKENLSRR